MKKIMFTAVAAMFAFASMQAFAAEATTTMTEEQCKMEMEKCGTDAQCKAELVKKGCKEEAPAN